MDIDAFLDVQWDRSTEFVPVPELAPYFKAEIDAALADLAEKSGLATVDDIDPKRKEAIRDKIAGFTVQGLTGPELGQAKKAATERKNLVAIAEGILSGMPKNILDNIKKLYGGGKDMTEEDALGFHVLMRAIVKPAIPGDKKLQVLRRMYDYFPVDFRYISNRAMFLTGRGHVPGKPKGSTPSPE